MEQLDINQHNDDTICAVSTPAGVGGIAVVRVSGRDAVKCVMKSWRGADLNAVQTHTLHLGRIVDTDGETLDDCINEQIITELKSVDLNTLSPLECMTFLFDLKKRL